MATLLASCGVHLCPSAREGFGHYINEARAASALVVTVDEPPMRDFVEDGVSGVLMPASRKRAIGNNQFGLMHADVRATEITAAVRKVGALSVSERSGMGQAARRRYEAEAAKFVETMRAVGEVVCAEAPAGGKAARLDPRLGLE